MIQPISYIRKELCALLDVNRTTLWKYLKVLDLQHKQDFSESDRLILATYKLYARLKPRHAELSDEIFLDLIKEQGLGAFLEALRDEFGVNAARQLLSEITGDYYDQRSS